MREVIELADRYVAYRKHTEHESALWSGDTTHLELWDDVTQGGQELRAATLLSMKAEASELLATLPRSTSPERSLLETIAFGAEAEIIGDKWREELRWVNHTTGIVTMILTFLPRFRLETAEHGQRYLDKIHNFPKFLDSWQECLATGAAGGVVPIRHHVTSVIDGIELLLAGQMSASQLARQNPPEQLAPNARETWREQLLLLLDTAVAPAFRGLADTLRDITLPAARPDDQPGLCHLDGGDEHYERLLWASTSIGMDAEQIHTIGLTQIELLASEYRALGKKTFGTTDLDEIFAGLRSDPALHYRDANTIVNDATNALERAAAVAPAWFGRLPTTPCSAMAIEQGPLAFYSRPLLDGSTDGTFFFNTAVPEMWGTFQLEATTFHEGIPGHHLQLALAVESEHLHDVHREFSLAAYSEGWGLYAERLADEMGLYTSDLDRVGMLVADSMRACRLVVDTGIHAKGWTREEAIAFMTANAPMTDVQIQGEIDRYIGLPGQATSYMIGRLEIEEIRKEASKRPDWSIVGFHDRILSGGSVPLPTLRDVVLG